MINPDHALSPKSGHGTSLRIEWGIVQIPVRLHLVVDSDRSVPARSMFSPAGNKIGYAKRDTVTGQDVPDDQIVKKVEVADGTWVELTDAEIEQHCTSGFKKGFAPIVSFVPLDTIHEHYIVEKPGAWLPEKTKVGKVKIVDPGAAKAYSLLTTAMRNHHVAALVLVPTRSGGQYVALFPDGSCGWLAYAENVRTVTPAEPVDVSKDELALASQLIEAIGVDTPVLRDTAGERIREYLVAKADNPEAATSVDAVETVAPVVDLAALLAASIADKAPVKAKRTRKAS